MSADYRYFLHIYTSLIYYGKARRLNENIVRLSVFFEQGNSVKVTHVQYPISRKVDNFAKGKQRNIRNLL